jgi:hypothetical protein
MANSIDPPSASEESQNEAEAKRIECHTSLSAYFHETLTRAFASKGIEAPPLTEFYLVSLLEALGHDTAALSRTLVEMSIESERETHIERLARLRSLGDQALSVSGLFDSHLERRGISRSYVVDVGRRAYRSASQLASASGHTTDRSRAAVFFDLSSRFQTYAEVLEGVREATALGTPDDVLALYERFCKTRSPALAERLLAHGVVSVPGSDDIC